MTQPIAVPVGPHPPLVYFIRLGSRVKIGYSTNLAGRVAGLSLSPRFVVLTIDGDRTLESRMHQRFAAERERGTEWFVYSERLRQYIREQRAGQSEDLLLGAVQEAERIVLEARIASASMLKRKMRISWGRAQSLMSELEQRGIVGALEGPGCSREVLVRTPVAVTA
ncbi:DNA translocase FtsK [Streptomyces sp. NPDC058694]|uniref:GIY-YIG nuclease family protein n=1 Tax=Streptomyces sp. NPDC058694 TaxID=3346603 RepID=UPI00365C5023